MEIVCHNLSNKSALFVFIIIYKIIMLPTPLQQSLCSFLLSVIVQEEKDIDQIICKLLEEFKVFNLNCKEMLQGYIISHFLFVVNVSIFHNFWNTWKSSSPIVLYFFTLPCSIHWLVYIFVLIVVNSILCISQYFKISIINWLYHLDWHNYLDILFPLTATWPIRG